jgi:hypothetical protein
VTPPRLTRALWLRLEARAAADGITPDEAIVLAVERYVRGAVGAAKQTERQARRGPEMGEDEA